ncbi:MAG: hypothetical protein WKG32_05075 [Gemmatimonadaceae bacterium]
MGLHLCYELSLPAEAPEGDVAARVAALRERAAALPFDRVSEAVRLTEHALSGPSPLRGLAYDRLEDVAHVSAEWARTELYRRLLGIPEDDEYTRVEVPPEMPTVAHAFAVAPGRGCEPATFGLAQLSGPGHGSSRWSSWWWHRCCKTQYASVLGDEHLLRCHGSLVALLDAAAELGLQVVVRDETGYWESRDPRQLAESVAEMNRVVARIAGKVTDTVRDAGGDGRQVRGAIFEHPDFERLETGE